MKVNGRDIIVLPKEPHLRSSEEKWGVRATRGKRIKKKLLVLGTGRCGTMFTTKALQTVGVHVLHEKVGEHGTVSHYFVTDSDWYPMAPWQDKALKKHVGERRSDFEFENVLHIVRDPRKAIPSMTKIFGSVTWQFYIDNGIIPDGIKNPMLRAMHLWVAHNKLAEQQAALTFQLERYEHAWSSIAGMLNVDAPYPRHLKPMNKTTGFKQYEPETFGSLIQRCPDLGREIRSMALNYGYKDQGVK